MQAEIDDAKILEKYTKDMCKRMIFFDEIDSSNGEDHSVKYS